MDILFFYLKFPVKIQTLASTGWNQEEQNKITGWYIKETTKLSYVPATQSSTPYEKLAALYHEKIMEMCDRGYSAEEQQKIASWYSAESAKLNSQVILCCCTYLIRLLNYKDFFYCIRECYY
jgi:hypothetical protein